MPARNEPGIATPTRAALRQPSDHHDHHQQNRRDHVVLQVLQHGADIFRLVLRVVDPDARGPGFTLRFDQRPYLRDGVDNVGADSLRDLQRYRRLTIDPGVTAGIFEGAPGETDIGKCHHPVAGGFDRKVEHVVNVFEKTRDFYREPAATRIERPGRYQLVVSGNKLEQGFGRLVVGFQTHRVDHHFQQVLAVAGDINLEDPRQTLELVANVAGFGNQGAFRYIAVKSHHNDRKERHIDLVHARFLGVGGQLGLGDVNFFAHIAQCLVGVESRLELEGDSAKPLGCLTAELLQAFNGAQLLLHRS